MVASRLIGGGAESFTAAVHSIEDHAGLSFAGDMVEVSTTRALLSI